MAACDDNTSTRYNRYDAYYTLGGQQSVESEDRIFNGTSSACPVTCGIIATKLQYNRTWSVTDVKNWLQNKAGIMPTTNFYYGTEETSATSTGWSDKNALHDSSPIIIWDALTGAEGFDILSISGVNLTISGNITITHT